MVQVPAARMVTSAPSTSQMAGVALAKLTGSPDVAEATRVTGPSVSETSSCCSNVIDWLVPAASVGTPEPVNVPVTQLSWLSAEEVSSYSPTLVGVTATVTVQLSSPAST